MSHDESLCIQVKLSDDGEWLAISDAEDGILVPVSLAPHLGAAIAMFAGDNEPGTVVHFHE